FIFLITSFFSILNDTPSLYAYPLSLHDALPISGKPDIEYRFFDHVRYLDAFLDKAGTSSAYVVAHDWGSALAFHLAARRPEFVRDRKSTRLNSSHDQISYAVFCLNKKTNSSW